MYRTRQNPGEAKGVPGDPETGTVPKVFLQSPWEPLKKSIPLEVSLQPATELPAWSAFTSAYEHYQSALPQVYSQQLATIQYGLSSKKYLSTFRAAEALVPHFLMHLASHLDQQHPSGQWFLESLGHQVVKELRSKHSPMHTMGPDAFSQTLDILKARLLAYTLAHRVEMGHTTHEYDPHLMSFLSSWSHTKAHKYNSIS